MQRSCRFFILKIIILFGSLHIVSGAEIRCYEGSLDSYTVIPLDNNANPETLLRSSCYSPDKDTVIYTHGLLDKITDNSQKLVLQAYLDGGKTNIIGMDWFEEVSVPFVGVAAIPKSFVNIVLIGRKLGKLIVKLTDAGLNLARLHLIGFSIGAHCMGEAGRYVRDNLNMKVPRITGLEASGPLTDKPLAIIPSLEADCAQFVDVYHTNPGVLGSVESLGTVDIWVNCRSNIQPGCENSKITNIGVIHPKEYCSHILVTKFYADAIRQRTAYVASSASDCASFYNGEVTGETTYLGDNINKTATGNYYITIDSSTEEYQTPAAAKEIDDLQQREFNIKPLFPDLPTEILLQI